MTNLLTSAEIAKMRDQVLETRLDMLCTVERFAITGTDAYNQPISTWSDHLVGLPCHFWEQRISYAHVQFGAVQATVTNLELIVPALTDIKVEDRIKTITNSDGMVVVKDLFILQKVERLVHILLELSETSV